MDIGRFTKILSRELSQTTSNLLSGTLMGMNSGYKKYYEPENSLTNLNNMDNWTCSGRQSYLENNNTCSNWWYNNNKFPEAYCTYNKYHLDSGRIWENVGSDYVYNNCGSKYWYPPEW